MEKQITSMAKYDETKPCKYIMYLDAKSLYGCAMSQYLPIGRYKWMTEKPTDKLMNKVYINPDAEKGYIFEVVLEYPA